MNELKSGFQPPSESRRSKFDACELQQIVSKSIIPNFSEFSCNSPIYMLYFI